MNHGSPTGGPAAPAPAPTAAAAQTAAAGAAAQTAAASADAETRAASTAATTSATTVAPGPALAAPSPPALPPPPAGRGRDVAAAATWTAAFAAVTRGQLARARVARVPLLFVASFQSIGILLLLRGVVDSNEITREQVVAGATVLVAAFVALNLLAQRLGALRAGGGLDTYRVLGAPGTAVVLGCAVAYSAFAVPGAVVTAVLGCLLYHLPLAGLGLLVVVLPLAGAALAGVGALIGLLAPRPELATVGGQLGMSAVVFLGLIPAHRLPGPVRLARLLTASTPATDALSAVLRRHVHWAAVGTDLAAAALVAVVLLAAAAAAWRRTAAR